MSQVIHFRALRAILAQFPNGCDIKAEGASFLNRYDVYGYREFVYNHGPSGVSTQTQTEQPHSPVLVPPHELLWDSVTEAGVQQIDTQLQQIRQLVANLPNDRPIKHHLLGSLNSHNTSGFSLNDPHRPWGNDGQWEDRDRLEDLDVEPLNFQPLDHHNVANNDDTAWSDIETESESDGSQHSDESGDTGDSSPGSVAGSLEIDEADSLEMNDANGSSEDRTPTPMPDRDVFEEMNDVLQRLNAELGISQGANTENVPPVESDRNASPGVPAEELLNGALGTATKRRGDDTENEISPKRVCAGVEAGLNTETQDSCLQRQYEALTAPLEPLSVQIPKYRRQTAPTTPLVQLAPTPATPHVPSPAYRPAPEGAQPTSPSYSPLSPTPVIPPDMTAGKFEQYLPGGGYVVMRDVALKRCLMTVNPTVEGGVQVTFLPQY